MESVYTNIANLRNIGFAAHIDAGKTTTTERILYYTKRIHRLGDVDEGTATTDYLIQEKERGITITSAAVSCYWKDHRINIIDTPGHVDFTVEVERSLRVLDGLIVIFCGVAGVQPQSETVWHQAERYKVPRIVFINKLDRIGADPWRVVKEIEGKFNKVVIPLQIPVGLEDSFKGVVDLVELKRYIWDIDETGEQYRVEQVEFDEIREAREKLIDKLAEVDEEIIEYVLEGKEITSDVLKHAIRRVTISMKAVPIFMGSALKNKGIQPLLDGIVNYLPSPLDKGEVVGVDPKTGEKRVRKPLFDEPFSAVVFKIQNDPHAGNVLYTRVYSGTISVNQKVLNASTGKIERVLRIYLLHADKKEQVKEAKAGEIVGLVGIKDVKTGDTLCDPENPIFFEGMHFPEPLISIAIEPKSSKDDEKLKEVLTILQIEDPSFKVGKDRETGQLLISGMGELHLEIIVDRIVRDFNVPVRTGKPQVAYRETITETREWEESFEREVGGVKERGYAKIRLLPRAQGEGNKVTINFEINPQLREHYINVISESLSFGPLLGYPVTDVEVQLLALGDESIYTHLGNELALRKGVQKGLQLAKPVLLEPVVLLEVVCPIEYVGNVVSDLGHRGGELDKIESLGEKVQKIRAYVPLTKLLGYVTDLRSLTQGRASFWMKLDHYAPIKNEKSVII
ncbi:MAG: elongation factor G [candidate division WOR-3 bacterium]